MKKAIRDPRTKNFIEILAISVDALIDYQTQGYQIKWLGEEKVDSDMAYKLEVTFTPNRTEHWFLHAKSFLPIKRSSIFTYEAAPTTQAIFYFDYRAIAGCMMPHSLERTELHYVLGYEVQ